MSEVHLVERVTDHLLTLTVLVSFVAVAEVGIASIPVNQARILSVSALH